jgi:hypothetical protein
MKASLHSLTPFLPFLLNHLRLPSPELDPTLILVAWDPRCIASRRTHRKHRFLYCCERVFTEPFNSNWSYSIGAWVFVTAEICLASSCLAMDVSFDFAIPAFGRRVTIFEILSQRTWLEQTGFFPVCFCQCCLIANSLDLSFRLLQ